MKNKNILKYIAFALLCLQGIILFHACIDRTDSNRDQHKVLLIQSYRSDSPWREELVQGSIDGLKDKQIDGLFDRLFLDREFHTEEEQLKIIHDYFEEYGAPDLIVLCNDQAIHSFLKSDNPLTYEVPVVFCGASYWHDNLLNGRQNVTGFTTTPDYTKILALTQSCYPEMKGIIFDVDDSYLSGLAIEAFQEQIRTNNAAADLSIQINNLDHSLGSSLMWNASFDHQHPRIMPVWSRFYASRARNTEIPFFSIDYKGLGQGYLGGYIVQAYDMAYEATTLGASVLKGKPITEIPITASEKKLVIDWHQLKKCGISRDKLPADCLFINQSIFEEYGVHYLLFVFVGISVFLLALTVAFLFYRKARRTKKKAQEELEEHRWRLKVVMSSIQEGVISVDRNMNIFTINPAALSWLQLEGEEELYKGKNVLSLIELSDGVEEDLLKSLIQTVFTTNKTIEFNMFQILSKACGHSSPVVGSISAIHQEEELYGAVIVFHDITEELAQREFLELTLDAGDVVSWHLDYQNRLITFDPSFFTMYQIKDNGTHSFSLGRLAQMIQPEDLPDWEEVNRKFATGELTTLLYEMRVDVDGRGYQWWELRYSSIQAFSEKEIPQIFGLVRNIEHEKQRLQDIENARNKAEMSDRLKSAFLANMSHEIRTPLNAIVGFSNVLTSDEELASEERQVFIDTIRNNCGLLLGLISDVLDIAQIETGAMSFKEEICDVNELINQILITQRVIIPEHLALIGDLPEKTAIIITDKLRLNQVITNLINNAVKFTEKGSVTVGYTCENEEILRFFVEDTGKGIPEVDLFKGTSKN